jgi:chemotaxis protein CheD
MSARAVGPRPNAEGPRQIFLTPGTLYCGSEPAVISTVLGSCVAVCLMDRNHRASGMNHYVLPSHPDGESSLRYGDIAIERLIFRMSRLGCGIGDLRAKVFGGAAVLPFGTPEDTVGTKNVKMAFGWLRNCSIPVVAHRTGGEHGLMVRLYTATGRVMVRPIVGRAGMPAGDRIVPHDSRTAPAADD